MKIDSSVTHKFEFTGLNEDVPSSTKHEVRKSVITHAVLTWEEYSKPQDELDGDTTYFDYKLKGFNCNADGKIDGRQKNRIWLSFNNSVLESEFILSLIDKLEPSITVASMRTVVGAQLDRAIQRDKERLARLMSP